MNKAYSGVAMAAVVAMGAASVGCVSSVQQVPVIGPPATVSVGEFKREDYVVLGDATARSCRKVIALWPIPLWFQYGEGGFGVYGWIWNALDDAWQKALASQPEADAVLMPRGKKDETFAVWFHSVCYEVHAKAIHLKSDSQRWGGASPSASPAPAIPPPPPPP